MEATKAAPAAVVGRSSSCPLRVWAEDTKDVEEDAGEDVDAACIKAEAEAAEDLHSSSISSSSRSSNNVAHQWGWVASQVAHPAASSNSSAEKCSRSVEECLRNKEEGLLHRGLTVGNRVPGGRKATNRGIGEPTEDYTL